MRLLSRGQALLSVCMLAALLCFSAPSLRVLSAQVTSPDSVNPSIDDAPIDDTVEISGLTPTQVNTSNSATTASVASADTTETSTVATATATSAAQPLPVPQQPQRSGMNSAPLQQYVGQKLVQSDDASRNTEPYSSAFLSTLAPKVRIKFPHMMFTADFQPARLEIRVKSTEDKTSAGEPLFTITAIRFEGERQPGVPNRSIDAQQPQHEYF